MDEKIDFGKYRGASYLEVPIEYLVYMEKKIHQDREETGHYDSKRLETIEYWLDERYLENDEHDRREAWRLEHDKVKEVKPKPTKEISLTSKDVAKFIIASYGRDFSLLVAEDIKSELTNSEIIIPTL